jgi:UDP-N-acetylglucosamine 2-epimerase (non-hydrolysing)
LKKILFIIGTRPEAIKMKPVIEKCEKLFNCKICFTNQHKNLNNFINFKKEKIIYLKLKRKDSNLTRLTSDILDLLNKESKIKSWKPDLIVVHGDTTSSFCGALYAFYEKIKLCHIESGLRTQDKNSPFPEEFNRRTIDYLADINFCPTKTNKKNLLNENLKRNNYVVGNTIIDTLKKEINLNKKLIEFSDYIVVTIHRRENWGSKIEKSLKIINEYSLSKNKKIVYVCNNNDDLKKIVKDCLGKNPNILLLDPLSLEEFRCLLRNSSCIVTDSGGIQEEACYYGKPLLILRDNTERTEAVNNLCAKLVDIKNLSRYLNNIEKVKFKTNKNLYGKGDTSDAILKILSNTNT